LDCYFENQSLSLEQVEILHQNKTAKLIAASLQMGAVVAGLSKEIQNALFEFGLDLGLLFQVQDDIIDVTQSSQEAGKTTQNDENKNSFVTLLGLEKSLEYANDLAKKLEGNLQGFDYKTQQALKNAVAHYLWRHKN